MKKILAALMGLAFLGLASTAYAAAHAKPGKDAMMMKQMEAMKGMLGKWKWEAFMIDCMAGGANGMSCKVTSGPKNVGMDMIQSKLAMDPGGFFKGKVAHPMTGETYNAKMTPKGADAFMMDGCTDKGACASGLFTRVK